MLCLSVIGTAAWTSLPLSCKCHAVFLGTHTTAKDDVFHQITVMQQMVKIVVLALVVSAHVRH